MNSWKQPRAKAHQGSSLMDLKAWNVFVSQSHLRVLSWSHSEAGCEINVIISKSPSNWLQVIVWAWTGSVCHEADLLQWLCEDRGCVLCVEEARGERCVWSGEAFLCVLLAARVLLPSLVRVRFSGNSLMVSFWRAELDFLNGDTESSQWGGRQVSTERRWTFLH